MTLPATSTTTDVARSSVEQSASATDRPDPPIRRRVAAISLVTLAAVLGAWAIFALFEGPVARNWYSTRQRALAADFKGAHAHSGRGHAIAIMQAPRIGLNVVVAEGDAPQQLRGGPGHRLDTPLPGRAGNSVIVGHHDDWGGPFRAVGRLRAGDLVAVQTFTPDGSLQTAVYKVQSVGQVSATDPAPFATSGDARLTLLTGRGGRFSDDRLSVVAVSGVVSKKLSIPRGASTSFGSGRVLTSSGSRLVLFGAGGMLLAWLSLRRRFRAPALAAVIGPLAVIALLGALLDIDLFLAPLR